MRRVAAMVRKEVRDYRRNRSVVITMVVLPTVFLAVQVTGIFRLPASVPASQVRAQVGLTLVLMLLIPVIVPAAIAAQSVIGEREQGTLEPVLTTPVRREEFLLGKALAAVVPAVGISWAVFAVFMAGIRLEASHPVVAAVWQPAWFWALLLFVPLLATWSIWVGMAISVRASDVRAAQQLGMLASLPPIALTSLMSFQVVHPSVNVAIVLALALGVIDIAAWRLVSAMFDRERLVTGTRATRGSPGRA